MTLGGTDGSNINVMWRDLEDPQTLYYESYAFIYNIYDRNLVGHLPGNYYLACRRF